MTALADGVALPFDHARATGGRGWAFFLNLAESVPPLVLAVALLLLAGPRRQGEPRTRRALTNIEFCVDVSGSMTSITARSMWSATWVAMKVGFASMA